MQVDLGDVLRAADPLGPIGNAELSTPDKFLLPSIVERDRLWCQALIATLSVKDIAKVTTMFNKLRVELEYRGKITVSATDANEAEEKAEDLLMQGRVTFKPTSDSVEFNSGAVVRSVTPYKRKAAP
jgi:hypothetical protein